MEAWCDFMWPINTRSMRCCTVIVPVGNWRSLSSWSSGMARRSLAIRGLLSRNRARTSALVAWACSLAWYALISLKSTGGVGLSSRMALIRFMIQSWFTATWWAITPTNRLSSWLLIRSSGVFFPVMRQCSTVSDSTRRMKLSCAASNWSARRAERVVLESGMTQLSDALLGDRGLPAVVLAARPRSQGLEPISKQLDVLRAGHEIDFRQGEPVGSRRCGADLHRVTGLSQLGAGLLCQLLGGHVEVIDDLCRFLEIPTRLSQLLKGELIKSPLARRLLLVLVAEEPLHVARG